MVGDRGGNLVIQHGAEDLHRLAEFDQRERLFQFRHAETGRAGAVQTFGDFFHAESVCVCLQDRENLQRFHGLLNMSVIAFNGIQVDFQPNPAVRGNFRRLHLKKRLLFRKNCST